MDRLTIKSLQLRGHHGVYEEERKSGNLFELDVTLFGDFRQAARQDDLTLAPDYEKVEEIAAAVIEGPSRQLIETLCLRIGEALMEGFPEIRSMEIALRKLSPALKHRAAYTEIRMQWQR